jgi:hypothetical protein
MDGCARGGSVFRCAGKEFIAREVRGRFDRRIRSSWKKVALDSHREGAVQGQGADGVRQAAFGQDRWMDATNKVAQFDERISGRLAGLGDQGLRQFGIQVDEAFHRAKGHAERDKPGLGSAMQITFDAAQLGGLRVGGVRP